MSDLEHIAKQISYPVLPVYIQLNPDPTAFFVCVCACFDLSFLFSLDPCLFFFVSVT